MFIIKYPALIKEELLITANFFYCSLSPQFLSFAYSCISNIPRRLYKLKNSLCSSFTTNSNSPTLAPHKRASKSIGGVTIRHLLVFDELFHHFFPIVILCNKGSSTGQRKDKKKTCSRQSTALRAP